MTKKKIEQQVETPQPMEQSPQPSVDAGTQSTTAGWETILDHVQKQDAKINELEGTLKDLLTYLQQKQGVQTEENTQNPQQQGGNSTLGDLAGILQAVVKQNQSDAPSLAQQLAEMQIENMRLTNQYIMKRMIGDAPEATIQHATVG